MPLKSCEITSHAGWFKSSLRNKATISALGDQVVVSGGNFLTIALCAHFLPLAEQGKLTYVFATYMGLLLLNIASIYQGAAVRAPTEGVGYLVVLKKIQVTLALLTSAGACVLWMIVGDWVGWNVTWTELVLVLIFLFLQQLADFKRRSAYIFLTPHNALLASLTTYCPRVVLLLFCQVATMSDALIIMGASALLPALSNYWPRREIDSKELIDATTRALQHLAYSWLFILGAPLGWLWSYAPIFLLGAMYGKEQAALLASIRGISSVANVLMEQLETKVVAEWARTKAEGDLKTIKRSSVKLFQIGIGIWIVGIVMIAFAGENITRLILGDTYAPYWGLLAIIWLGYGLYFVARLMGVKCRALGSKGIEFVANVVGTIVAIFAGWFLILDLGIFGAAWIYVCIPISMYLSQLAYVKMDRK